MVLAALGQNDVRGGPVMVIGEKQDALAGPGGNLNGGVSLPESPLWKLAIQA